jgi:DNA-binding transcriptional MocR family regulator
VEAKVACVPGAAFCPDTDEQIGETLSGDRFARLCLTFANETAIDVGCQRLGQVLAG